MQLKIKLHPEIITKSESVRKRFIKILGSNIRQSLNTYKFECSVMMQWDHIMVRAKCDPIYYPVFLQILRQVPGIQSILVIREVAFESIHNLFEQVLKANEKTLVGKSFCVRVKRKGKHDFNSIDVERYVGGGLRQHIPGTTVNLTNPEVQVNLEIDQDKAFIVEKQLSGIGGFPIGTQDQVLSLISGGYDSAVSSYQMIRRGCKLHYLFFNLGGNEHLQHVKRIATKVWQGYSASHNVKFINVDFYPIMLAISSNVVDGYTGVVLKRMFYRVANAIAARLRIDAMVTGEALGQVSSQTLKNLRIIEEISDIPVLRPLVATDKEEIIRIASQIGTARLSAQVQEFCGIMGTKPTIAADREKLEIEEAKLDIESLVAQAVSSCQTFDMRELATQNIEQIEHTEIEFVKQLDANKHVVIDIRDPAAVEENPTSFKVTTLQIPFYQLGDEISNLDQRMTYVLYCKKGLLSRIQATNLHDRGYNNVCVLSKEYKEE